MNILVERRVDFVLMMGWIMIFPQAVMNTVRTHLHEHEEIPVFFRDPLLDQLKAFLGHSVNLTKQVFFIVCTEVWHIHQVLADGSLNLLHDGSGIGIRPIGILGRRGEETTYLDAIDGPWRIGLWNTHGDDLF